MKNQENAILYLFEEMLKRGFISTSNTWIEKAIEQKNARFPIGIAYSKLLIYDKLDIKLLNQAQTN